MTTITALTDLSKLPNQSQDQATFDANMAYYLENLALRAQQENALAANLNSIAAGGAYAIPYTFSNSAQTAGAKILTVDDPSAQASTPTLRLNTTDASGANVSALLGAFNASTSAVKGVIRVQKVGDPSKWLMYYVATATVNAGYYSFSVSSAGSSSAAPFAIGDALMLFFQRTGDKGDTGAGALTQVMHVTHSGAIPSHVVGMNVRVLNTVLRNTVSGASLASNRVTLPAGTYRVRGDAGAHGVGSHQGYLYNVTTAATIVVGTSEYDAGYSSRSIINGEFVLAATSQLELRHYSGGTAGSLGYAAGSGQGEVHAQLFIEKVAN